MVIIPLARPSSDVASTRKKEKTEAVAETVRAILHHLDTGYADKKKKCDLQAVFREIADLYDLRAWPVGSTKLTRRNARQVGEAIHDLVRKHCKVKNATAQDLIAHGSAIISQARLAQVQYGHIAPPPAQGLSTNISRSQSPGHSFEDFDTRQSRLSERLEAARKPINRSSPVARPKRKLASQPGELTASASSKRMRMASGSSETENESCVTDDNITIEPSSGDESDEVVRTSVPYADSTHYALEHNALRKDLQRLLSQVRSVTGDSLAQTTTQNQPAQFNLNPDGELGALYSTCVGRELSTRTTERISARLTAADFVIVLVSSFVYKEIFQATPIFSTKERFAMVKTSLGETIGDFEKELETFSKFFGPVEVGACSATDDA